MTGGDGGQEDAGVFGERDGNGGDGAGLDDEEQRPAVEEAPEAAEGFAQVDVLAAGVRHGGGEFAVAEGGDDGERRADQPAEDQQAGRFHLARDIGADDEDAGADHRAHDERGGGGEAEAFDEAGGLLFRRHWVNVPEYGRLDPLNRRERKNGNSARFGQDILHLPEAWLFTHYDQYIAREDLRLDRRIEDHLAVRLADRKHDQTRIARHQIAQLP